MNDLPDRLEGIKARLKSARIYYSIPNRQSTYLMDVEDAGDDLAWMIYEIERLRTALAEAEERETAS